MLNQEEMRQLKTALALQEKMILNSVSEQEVERVTFSERFERKMKRLFIRSEKIYYPMINTVLKRVACFALATIVLTSLVGAGVYALIRQRNARVIAPYFISESVLNERLYTSAEGEYVLLTYLKSEKTEAEVLHWYRDKDRSEYAFDENGNLISITLSDKAQQAQLPTIKTPITEKQAKIFAQQYAKDFAGKDFDRFELTEFYYNESSGLYSAQYQEIYFGKYVGEYLAVVVDEDGKLRWVSRPKQSELYGFDPACLQKINETGLEEYIEQQVRNEFTSYKVDYTIRSLEIEKKDNIIGIMAYLVLMPDDGLNTTVGYEIFYPLN